MTAISFWLAVAALVTGIIAAYYWALSANIDQSVDPRLPIGDITEDPEVLREYIEHIYGHFFKLQDTSRKAARLNRYAAGFTAVSVFLGGLSAMLGSSGSH